VTLHPVYLILLLLQYAAFRKSTFPGLFVSHAQLAIAPWRADSSNVKLSSSLHSVGSVAIIGLSVGLREGARLVG